MTKFVNAVSVFAGLVFGVGCAGEVSTGETPDVALENLEVRAAGTGTGGGWFITANSPVITPLGGPGAPKQYNITTAYRNDNATAAQRKGGACVLAMNGYNSCSWDADCSLPAGAVGKYCVQSPSLGGGKYCFARYASACLVAQDLPSSGTLAPGATYTLPVGFTGTYPSASWLNMSVIANQPGGCADHTPTGVGTQTRNEDPAYCTRVGSGLTSAP